MRLVLVLASLIGSVRDREGAEVETTERGGAGEHSVGVEGRWRFSHSLGSPGSFSRHPAPPPGSLTCQCGEPSTRLRPLGQRVLKLPCVIRMGAPCLRLRDFSQD